MPKYRRISYTIAKIHNYEHKNENNFGQTARAVKRINLKKTCIKYELRRRPSIENRIKNIENY